jgi:hypothetical protein
MKAALPILICSAITGALGYYFGHITLPPAGETTASATTSTSPSPSAETSAFDGSTAAEVSPPAPVEPEEPTAEALASTDNAPEPGEDDFATRAAKTVHTLTDTQGRSIQASIVQVMESEVKIRRNDGLETTIPLNMLSEEDVAFCNYLREQQAPEPVQTPDTSEGFDWDAYFNS